MNAEAEQSALACVTSGLVTFAELEQALKVDDFAIRANRLIFGAMSRINARGGVINSLTLFDDLGNFGEVSDVGGLTALTTLNDWLPPNANAQAIFGIVQEKSRLRAIVTTSTHIAGRAGRGENSATLIHEAMDSLRQLQANGTQPEAPAIFQWPDAIREEGFHGIAGAIVRAIEPHSEADPAALLVQTLILMGSIFGRLGYYLAEGDRHHANEYAVIVGTTSKGRKGTSMGRVMSVSRALDEEFIDNRIIHGVGSGEGLLDAFSNDADCRALVSEGEFARLLAITNREGSTLSAAIRNGWDSGSMEIRTIKRKLKVKGAHLSIIGHITREELLRRLSETEMANGFGNRYLWVCARRSKILPHGGGSFELDPHLIRRLMKAKDSAAHNGNARFFFDDAASELWEQLYPELSEGGQGMLAMMTSRAEAHVVRLALIYALLDGSDKLIRVEHLRAALAVWDYCYASAKFIWGDAIGDAVADEILRALKATTDGMTRWDITDHFSRKKKAAELDRALGVLAERGLIRSVKEDTGGRTSTRYTAL